MTDAVAFVRAVPDSFAEAIVQGRRPVIDVARARAQHEAYRATLAEAGYRIEMIAADPAHPDCPFIEHIAAMCSSSDAPSTWDGRAGPTTLASTSSPR
jgi:dimethylargininase